MRLSTDARDDQPRRPGRGAQLPRAHFALLRARVDLLAAQAEPPDSAALQAHREALGRHAAAEALRAQLRPVYETHMR